MTKFKSDGLIFGQEMYGLNPKKCRKVIMTIQHPYVFFQYNYERCDGIIRGSSHPILEIFLTASISMILIFLPSIATIFSAANAESVRMALAVVMLDRLARSSLVR